MSIGINLAMLHTQVKETLISFVVSFTSTTDEKSEITETSAKRATQTVTRSKVCCIDFKLVCVLCEQQYKNNSNKMSRVETNSFCDNLGKRCKEKKDTDFERKIGNEYRKLPAFEARYHTCCLLRYMKADYKRKSDDTDPHQAHFTKLLNYLCPLLESGRALLMTIVLAKYKEFMNETMTGGQVQSYTTQKLKQRLEKHFGDQVVIESQNNYSKGNIIYSSKISVLDAINLARDYRLRFREPFIKRNCIR